MRNDVNFQISRVGLSHPARVLTNQIACFTAVIILWAELIGLLPRYYSVPHCIAKSRNSILVCYKCSAFAILYQASYLISEERNRASRLFHNSSTNKVNKECDGQLVENQVTLLQSECRQMIKDENLEGERYIKCHLCTSC